MSGSRNQLPDHDLPVVPDGDTSPPSSANPSGTPPLAGSLEEIANTLRSFAAEGISHVQVWLEPNTLAGIEAFVPVLELLDRGA